MENTIEQLLSRAEELGRLIRKTEIYMNYMRMSGLLEADRDAVEILDDFTKLSGQIKNRQDMGDIIEKFEIEDVKNLAGLVSGNETIMNYLSAQKEYLDLLCRIQEELGENEFNAIS